MIDSFSLVFMWSLAGLAVVGLVCYVGCGYLEMTGRPPPDNRITAFFKSFLLGVTTIICGASLFGLPAILLAEIATTRSADGGGVENVATWITVLILTWPIFAAPSFGLNWLVVRLLFDRSALSNRLPELNLRRARGGSADPELMLHALEKLGKRVTTKGDVERSRKAWEIEFSPSERRAINATIGVDGERFCKRSWERLYKHLEDVETDRLISKITDGEL